MLEAHAQSACSAGTINLSTGATVLTGEMTRKELLVSNAPSPCNAILHNFSRLLFYPLGEAQPLGNSLTEVD